MRISISWGGGELFVALDAGSFAEAVAGVLPKTVTASTWGEEVYFELGVPATRAADATDVVDAGTVCYWVEGGCLALPYGPTPASHGEECRLVTAVNIVGKFEGDPRALSDISAGDMLTVGVVS
jgi:hypothetical protein